MLFFFVWFATLSLPFTMHYSIFCIVFFTCIVFYPKYLGLVVTIFLLNGFKKLGWELLSLYILLLLVLSHYVCSFISFVCKLTLRI